MLSRGAGPDRGTDAAARRAPTCSPKGMLRCGCCGARSIAKRTTNEQGRVYERYCCGGKLGGVARTARCRASRVRTSTVP